MQGLGSRKLMYSVCSFNLFLCYCSCPESPPPSQVLACLMTLEDLLYILLLGGAFWDPPKWAVSPLLLYVPVGTTSALLQPEVHVGYFFVQTHSWESAVAPLPGPWLSMTLTERMMFCSSQSGGTRQ